MQLELVVECRIGIPPGQSAFGRQQIFDQFRGNIRV
jgi:hypothetical protein